MENSPTPDEYELIKPADRNILLGYLQLMRLPNVFTAMADVAMGFFSSKPMRLFPTGGRWRCSWRRRVRFTLAAWC